MQRKLLLLIALIIPVLTYSQQIERVEVAGVVSAPVGDDVEGISIYNISAQNGVVTDASGKFKIKVAKNDRVQVTALQFQTFTIIVDNGVVNTKQMNIYLNPAVNELEEVIVRPSDLTGNIQVDVARIKTADLNFGLDLSYETMEFDYNFAPDGQSSIPGNAAQEAFYNGQRQWGMNFVGLAGLLFGKKKKIDRRDQIDEKELLTTALWQRYSKHYVHETFGIPLKHVGDFLYFVEDKGLSRKLLKAENEVLLLEHLFAQSELYKLQIED